QGHRAELLDHRDDRADDEAGDDRRKHDRAKHVHEMQWYGLVAGKSVGKPNILRRIVEHVGGGAADDGENEEAQRYGEESWGPSPNEAVCSGQMGGRGLRHGSSPCCVELNSISFRATSRLVRCRLVPAGIWFCAILAVAAARNALSNLAK